MTTVSTSVDIHRDGAVATVTLTRPDELDALDRPPGGS